MNVSKVILASTGGLSVALLLSSGQVVAQQTASAQAMLEEIVVTARRREENLMELPLSIAAITADAMEAQGIYTIEQLGELVPNVTLDTGERRHNTQIIIRGIGGGSSDPVAVFGSGMYIDGHYIPNSLGGYMSTLDIERVEVLRGPQGTLFGKNVTGGLINIITAKPSPEFESSLTLRLAEDGQQDFRAMINGALGENVFGRVAVATETYDGYYYNRNFNIDTGGTDMTSINAALRFTPGDHWTIDTSLNYINNEDDQSGAQCGSRSGTGGRAFPLDANLYPGAEQDSIDACDADVAAGPFVNSSDKLTFVDLDVESVFVAAQWDSGGAVGGLDDLSVKLSGSYRKTDYDYYFDRNVSFYDIFDVGTYGAIGSDDITRGAEFLVEAQANDRLSFTAGVNYFYEKHKQGDGTCRRLFDESPISDVIPGSNPPAPVNGTPTVGFGCPDPSGLIFSRIGRGSHQFNMARVENESVGVFGHVTYSLNDDWTLDLGARWTEDDRNYWNMEVAAVGCSTNDQSLRAVGNAFATAEPGQCSFTVPMTFESVITNGFFNTADESWSEVTPMVSLTRHLAGGGTLDSGMFYFLYSEGFLTGGFNAEINTNLPAIAPLVSFGPEHVDNFEVGFKGTFFDGNLQIMAAIFYMDYTDKQEEIEIDNPNLDFGPQDPARATQNVSSVNIYGIELELRAVPWDGGFVSLDIGTLSNEYDQFTFDDPLNPGSLIDESNSFIQDQTPEWTVTLGLEHAFALANGAIVTPRLSVYAQDDYDFGRGLELDSPPSACNQKAYTKVGARVSYTPAAGNWRATLFGNNITDELYLEQCRGAFNTAWNYRNARPAYWGLEFTANWGE